MISRSKTWFFVFAILAFVLAAAFSLPTAAETLDVAKSGAQFSSIQTAIDAAEPGDTVQIREGVYKENLSVDKDLTLKGVGASKVKIDGQKEGYPVLHVGPSEVEVTVKDLTLQGAEGGCKDEEKGLCPTGVTAVGDSEFRVKGATISGNFVGIGFWGSTQATVENCKISRNDKGGIGLVDSARATVENNKISGNEQYGIGLRDSPQATVQNNSIRKSWVGIEIYEPGHFKGNLKGSGNQIKDNDTNFEGVSESTQKQLTRRPKEQELPLKIKGISLTESDSWRGTIEIDDETKSFSVSASFFADQYSDTPSPDLDIILTNPKGREYHSDLTQRKLVSQTETKLVEGLTVPGSLPGKWDIKVTVDRGPYHRVGLEFDLKVNKLSFSGIPVKDPAFPRVEMDEGPKEGKILEYVDLVRNKDFQSQKGNEYELRVYPNIGIVIPPSAKLSTGGTGQTYKGAAKGLTGFSIVGYSEKRFDRFRKVKAEDKSPTGLPYGLGIKYVKADGTVNHIERPEEKDEVINLWAALAQDITGTVIGEVPVAGQIAGFLPWNTLLAIRKYKPPAEDHSHKPVSKSLLTDNGFDQYLQVWSPQGFGATFKDYVSIPVNLTQQGSGKHKFYVYLKLKFANRGSASSSQVYYESIELEVEVGESGKMVSTSKVSD